MKNKSLAMWVVLGGIFSLPLLISCTSQINSLTDDTKFLLDKCNPADSTTLTSCTDAASKSTDIITADATNIDGPIFNSSAHLGLAGVDFLQVASQMADLANSNSSNNTSQTATASNKDNDDFSQFRSLVSTIETDNGRAIDTAELETAKSALVTLLASATATDDNKRAFFQLGVIQAIDGFIRPVKLAGSVTSVTSAASLTGITTAEAARINTDFFNADNNLASSGTTSSDFLNPVRQNFCLCKANAAAISDATATNVMSVTCLQDLMLCELKTDLTGVTLNNDYDGNLLKNGADCSTLLSPATLATCSAGNTS